MTIMLGGLVLIGGVVLLGWLCGFGKAEVTRVEAMRTIWPQGR